MSEQCEFCGTDYEIRGLGEVTRFLQTSPTPDTPPAVCNVFKPGLFLHRCRDGVSIDAAPLPPKEN